jgi:hypothetical protein
MVPGSVNVIKGDSNRHIERMRVRVQMKANVFCGIVVMKSECSYKTMPFGASSENSLGGGDGAGLGKSEGTAGVY